MQLDPKWLRSQGEDAWLLSQIDTAFFGETPDNIGVAVSGGGDSMALLHLYQRWAEQTGCNIAAVTVDHGLREGSKAEAAQVAAFCESAGIPHDILKWSGWDRTGNLQAKAREARYTLLAEWACLQGITGVALGHTQDDTAETFVMRLARKAGVDGLAAMESQWDALGVTWVRPLWKETRAELRSYLQRHEIGWIDDVSNSDERFERVRVRGALATLEKLGIDQEALHSVACNMHAARAALEHYVREEAKTRVTQSGASLQMTDLQKLPIEIERRLLSKAVQWVGHGQYPARAQTLEDALIRARREGRAQVAGCELIADKTTLKVLREAKAVATASTETTDLWDGKWRLDGPHAEGLIVRALGADGLLQCPDWRETGHSRLALKATPAVYQGDKLIAAPVAGMQNGWSAQIVADFASYLASH